MYYTPPSDKVFQEIKSECQALWKSIATSPEDKIYLKEKLQRTQLENIRDNAMVLINMFYGINQFKLANRLSREALEAIAERLQSYGLANEDNIYQIVLKWKYYKQK
jgi:hypothetical protein